MRSCIAILLNSSSQDEIGGLCFRILFLMSILFCFEADMCVFKWTNAGALGIFISMWELM